MRELVPFLFQGALIFTDEIYCHRRRTLRRWERLGHPLDALAFGLALVFLLIAPPTPLSRWIFGFLAFFSCLLISKDEWQHGELCDGFEKWLHAWLFMLHPCLLFWAGWLWWSGAPEFQLVVITAASGSFAFAAYQLIYWNVWRHGQQ